MSCNRGSESERLRQEGNAKYLGAQTPGLSRSLAVSRARQAFNLYTRAKDASSSDEEKASASKNLARAGLLILDIGGEPPASSRQTSLQALTASHSALRAGKAAGKSDIWMADMMAVSISALLTVVSVLEAMQKGDTPRVATLQAACHTLRLEGLLMLPELSAAVAVLYFMLAKTSFQSAVKSREKKIFHDANRFLADIGMSLQEAIRAYSTTVASFADQPSSDTDSSAGHWLVANISSEYHQVATELKELSADIEIEAAVVGGLLEIQMGEKAMENGLRGSEDLDVESLYMAVDHFRAAIVASRERDIEVEAQANSLIGSAWSALFPQQPSVAHPFFQRSLELALSLFPRVPVSTPWYSLAKQRVAAHQEQTVREEEAQEAKCHAPFLEKLKEEIDDLNKAAQNSASRLLSHLYETVDVAKYMRGKIYVAAFKEKLRSRDKEAELKKQLQTAILHFHTDKNCASVYGTLWHVYCNEITKLLSQKYNMFK